MFESEIANLYTAAIMVFAALVPVLNPFGGAMFFLTLTNGVDPHIRGAMANRIGLYSLIVLLVCLFAGNIFLISSEYRLVFCEWQVGLFCLVLDGRL